MAEVIIYTTQICPYCMRAKQLLQRKGVPYSEVDVSDDAEERQRLVARTRQRTVPQIFINAQPIGGCDELYALERSGQLDILLAS